MPQGAAAGTGYNVLAPAGGQPLTGTPWAGSPKDPVPAGKRIYFIWTGDPDADNDGWVLMYDDGTPNWKDYSVTTPHPQVVPDLIAGHTVYGFRRNFELTVNAGLAEDDHVVFLHKLSTSNYIAHIEIRDKDGTGANYEFTLNSSDRDSGILSPNTVDSHNSHIKRIWTGWTSALGRVIGVTIEAAAAGKTYEISIESKNIDLALIKVGSGVKDTSVSTLQSGFDASKDYPGEDLANFLKAQSGDAAALLPKGLTLGQDANGRTLQTGDGKITSMTGYWRLPAYHAGQETAFIKFVKADGTPLQNGDPSHCYGSDSYKDHTSQAIKSIKDVQNFSELVPSGAGFVSTSGTNAGVGTDFKFDLEVDRRSPAKTRVYYRCWYQDTGQHAHYFWYLFEVEKAKEPTKFYFSGWKNNQAVWEVYKN